MSIKRLIKQSILTATSYEPPIHRKGCIKLDLNENYSVLNGKLMKKIRQFDAFTTSSYPEYQELTPLVARYAGVPEECISLTNGSDHGIQLILDLFFTKGDTVIVPSPIFFIYYHFLKIKEVKITEVLYTEENGQYIFPLKETLKSLKAGVKGLILCNPNNPLGNSIPENEFVELLRKTKKLDIPLIVDEAYLEYSDVDATQYLSEYKNLIILRTFSKAFGLSGIRLGYVIADPEILHEMDKLKLTWSVNHCAVHAGITVLGEIPYFKKKIQEQKKIKDELYKVLSTRGIRCYRTDTNFLICTDPNYLHIISRLNESKILVNDVSHYPYSGTLLKNAFRINAPSRKDLDLLSNIL
jgi:histidinol-phosphate aminotransferase